MTTFYTVVTDVGAAKLAAAIANVQPLELTHFGVGDGGADGPEGVYDPVKTQTTLNRERHRVQINDIRIDGSNAAWLVVEAVIPATVGGWWIREAGIFDADGDMIAIAKYPESWKPVLADGVGKDFLLRIVFEHSNVAAVTLNIDPAVVVATRDHVSQKIAQHNADDEAHPLLNTYDMPLNAGWGSDGAGEDLEVGGVGAWLLRRNIEILEIRGRVLIAPEGGDIEIDVLRNGISIFSGTERPKFIDGQTILTPGTFLVDEFDDQKMWAADDVIEVKVLSVGATAPGQKMLITIVAKVR
jgi:hypothetical protein